MNESYSIAENINFAVAMKVFAHGQPTFPRFVLDVDGLCHVVAIFLLDTHKVGVSFHAEVGS